MSLSKFLCTHRGEIYTIFRKLRGWNVNVKNYCLLAERDGLSINLQLVGPPIVVYAYKRSLISILIDKSETEVVLSSEGNFTEIQKKIDSLLR